jgi:hypothetical protein
MEETKDENLVVIGNELNPLNKLEILINQNLKVNFMIDSQKKIIETTINDSLKYNYINTFWLACTKNNLSCEIIARAVLYRNLNMKKYPKLIEPNTNEQIINIIHKCINTPDDLIEQFVCWQNIKHTNKKQGNDRKQNLPRILREAWKTWLEQNLTDDLVTSSKIKIRKIINVLHCNPKKNNSIMNINKIKSAHRETFQTLLAKNTNYVDICNILIPELNQIIPETNDYKEIQISGKKSLGGFLSSFFYKPEKEKIIQCIQPDIKINIKHVDLLNNLINISSSICEINEENILFIKRIMQVLRNSVIDEKQNGLLYYNTIMLVEESKLDNQIKNIILNGLTNCLFMATENVDKNKESILLFHDSKYSELFQVSSMITCYGFEGKTMIGYSDTNTYLFETDFNINPLVSVRNMHSNENKCKIMLEHADENLKLFFSTIFETPSLYNFDNIVICTDNNVPYLEESIHKYHEFVNSNTSFFIIDILNTIQLDIPKCFVINYFPNDLLACINKTNNIWREQ